jgi:hypothetical protein
MSFSSKELPTAQMASWVLLSNASAAYRQPRDRDRSTGGRRQRPRRNEYVINGAATATSIWGTYYDDIQLESDGEWRFRKRTFRFTTVDPSMSKGPVLARFPCD